MLELQRLSVLPAKAWLRLMLVGLPVSVGLVVVRGSWSLGRARSESKLQMFQREGKVNWYEQDKDFLNQLSRKWSFLSAGSKQQIGEVHGLFSCSSWVSINLSRHGYT